MLHHECHRNNFVPIDVHADVAAIVVTYNSAADVSSLIEDLRTATRSCAVRLIVVDNGSSDGTSDVIRAHSDVIFVDSGGNLGYAGGINCGLRWIGSCDAVLVLNPDLRLAPDAVPRLLGALEADNVGAAVPLMLDENDVTYMSLRHEPSIIRAIGDALLGGKVRRRPTFSSEIDARPERYAEPHDVDWATGAAILVRASVAHDVGDWYEEFFLFSEETDYCRRIRARGHRIRFEPTAVVKHRQGGSGTSSLTTLLAVNRVRYVERHHGRLYSAAFRAAVLLAEALRSYDPAHRRTWAVVANRDRWRDLPKATRTRANA